MTAGILKCSSMATVFIGRRYFRLRLAQALEACNAGIGWPLTGVFELRGYSSFSIARICRSRHRPSLPIKASGATMETAAHPNAARVKRCPDFIEQHTG